MLLLPLLYFHTQSWGEEEDMRFDCPSELLELRSGGAEDMDEGRDPAIKLFGATIPVAATAQAAVGEAEEAANEGEVKEAESEPDASTTAGQKDISEEVTSIEVHDASAILPDEEKSAPISSSSLTSSKEDDKTTSSAVDKEASNDKSEDTKNETNGSVQEKVLKKPDKILPCPRCNSMDTKFCYYNNYNVNQPRHFCKNCQRYWTAGGTMRNVPVGAGRRKSKHSSSQCRNLVIPSDGLQTAQLDTLNLTHRALPCVPSTTTQPLIGNGTILKFAQEVPLCESLVSALNIRDQVPNADPGSTIPVENKEDPPCASSATASNFVENGPAKSSVHMQQSGTQVYCNGLTPPPPLQCYPGAPWAYPWGPAWNTYAAMEANRISSENHCRAGNSNSNLATWSPRAMMAATPFCAPTLPFPFIPPPFWGFTTWPNGAWPVPLVGSNGCLSPSTSTSTSGCSGNGSPTLGKHSRDSALQSEEKTKKCLWVPKTLRIDDPEEAAKSSIWSTLGIKPDIGGIFQSKAENKSSKSDAAQVLHANPAALSRSQSFQETT